MKPVQQIINTLKNITFYTEDELLSLPMEERTIYENKVNNLKKGNELNQVLLYLSKYRQYRGESNLEYTFNNKTYSLDVLCISDIECFRFSTTPDVNLVIIYEAIGNKTLLYESGKLFKTGNWLSKFLNLIQSRIDFVEEYELKIDNENKLKLDNEFIEKYKPFDIN